MTVAIIWSTTDSGSAISDPLDHGSDAAGATLVEQEIFLRHDGINPITDAGFYVAEKSGVYSGAASAALDLAELLAWGFGITVTAFGGILLNMDATGGYTGLWSTFSVKSGSTYNVFRTSVGDSAANKIILSMGMGLIEDGVVPAGSSPNVRFKMRIQLPTDEGVSGTRQVDQRLRYAYTS